MLKLFFQKSLPMIICAVKCTLVTEWDSVQFLGFFIPQFFGYEDMFLAVVLLYKADF